MPQYVEPVISGSLPLPHGNKSSSAVHKEFDNLLASENDEKGQRRILRFEPSLPSGIMVVELCIMYNIVSIKNPC